MTADLEAKAGEQKNDQNADQNASNNKCGITGFSPNAKFNFPLECFKIAAINFQCCITNVGPIINPLIKSSEVFSQTILKGLGQITLDSSEKLKILLQGVSYRNDLKLTALRGRRIENFDNISLAAWSNFSLISDTLSVGGC